MSTHAHGRPAPPRGRITVPEDARDLPGDFACRRSIEVRFADTDAMGHVNNAVYLTYCEMARAGYYESVIGRPLPLGVHGASEGMILADARVAYRSPAFFGETLDIETRVVRIGRSSLTVEHRLTAQESRYGATRLVAISIAVFVAYDYAANRTIPLSDELVAAVEAFEGQPLRA